MSANGTARMTCAASVTERKTTLSNMKMIRRTTGTISMSVRWALSWLSYWPLHFNVTPGRQLDCLCDALLDFLDKPAKVPAANVALHENAQQTVFA